MNERRWATKGVVQHGGQRVGWGAASVPLHPGVQLPELEGHDRSHAHTLVQLQGVRLEVMHGLTVQRILPLGAPRLRAARWRRMRAALALTHVRQIGFALADEDQGSRKHHANPQLRGGHDCKGGRWAGGRARLWQPARVWWQGPAPHPRGT